jgi:hypothetical protein
MNTLHSKLNAVERENESLRTQLLVSRQSTPSRPVPAACFHVLVTPFSIFHAHRFPILPQSTTNDHPTSVLASRAQSTAIWNSAALVAPNLDSSNAAAYAAAAYDMRRRPGAAHSAPTGSRLAGTLSLSPQPLASPPSMFPTLPMEHFLYGEHTTDVTSADDPAAPLDALIAQQPPHEYYQPRHHPPSPEAAVPARHFSGDTQLEPGVYATAQVTWPINPVPTTLQAERTFARHQHTGEGSLIPLMGVF